MSKYFPLLVFTLSIAVYAGGYLDDEPIKEAVLLMGIYTGEIYK